jgi:hypothetical protein
MALRSALQRLRTSVGELDRARLRDFCASVPGATRIVDLLPREEATVAGEITCIRIVPRPDGSPWLEATISDGTGSLFVMWTGRTHIAGVKPGRCLTVTGRGAPTGPGRRLLIYNPRYELLG